MPVFCDAELWFSGKGERTTREKFCVGFCFCLVTVFMPGWERGETVIYAPLFSAFWKGLLFLPDPPPKKIKIINSFYKRLHFIGFGSLSRLVRVCLHSGAGLLSLGFP